MTKTIKVGDTVVFNKLPDAIKFEVTAVSGVTLTVREKGTDYAPQRIDVSLAIKV